MNDKIVKCAKCDDSWETVAQSLGHEHFALSESVDSWDLRRSAYTARPVSTRGNVSGQEVLNAMIANFAGFGAWAWQDSPDARIKDNARFDTLLHAVTIVYPDWNEAQAEEWLVERVDDIRAAMAD